jgi:hypothetical protein
MADIDSTIDVHGLGDFLPTMPAVAGREALVQRLVRRLTTPRGRFIFWPNFGWDVREALLSKAQPSVVATNVQLECEKDEQVESCVAEVTRDAAGNNFLKVTVTDADGPFEFTMTISQAGQFLNARLSEGS